MPSPKSTPILTPIHPRSCSHQCLCPLLTHISLFHSYHIYIYLALVTGLQLFIRPSLHLHPRSYAHGYAHCRYPSFLFIVIIYVFLLCTDDLSTVISTPPPTPAPTPIRHRLRPLLTPIPSFHIDHINRYFALITFLQLFLRLTYTYVQAHTPMRPRQRPLLTPIPSFNSYHTYCYFILMTCRQSFIHPRLHLRPRPYAHTHVSTHCSHPSLPFIAITYIFTLHRRPFSSYFYALAYTYAHAHTPTPTPISTPIVHTHSFLS